MSAHCPVVVLVAAAALATVPAAGAQTAFKGDVCKLVPAKSIASIKGVSSNCTKGSAAPAPGATNYTAVWKGKTGSRPHSR